MNSQIFLCRIHSANQPQVQNLCYPSFVTTWTNIALVNFHHPERFQYELWVMTAFGISKPVRQFAE